jgi:hypothetical protein
MKHLLELFANTIHMDASQHLSCERPPKNFSSPLLEEETLGDAEPKASQDSQSILGYSFQRVPHEAKLPSP